MYGAAASMSRTPLKIFIRPGCDSDRSPPRSVTLWTRVVSSALPRCYVRVKSLPRDGPDALRSPHVNVSAAKHDPPIVALAGRRLDADRLALDRQALEQCD